MSRLPNYQPPENPETHHVDAPISSSTDSDPRRAGIEGGRSQVLEETSLDTCLGQGLLCPIAILVEEGRTSRPEQPILPASLAGLRAIIGNCPTWQVPLLIHVSNAGSVSLYAICRTRYPLSRMIRVHVPVRLAPSPRAHRIHPQQMQSINFD
jgi:hypothetical protein